MRQTIKSLAREIQQRWPDLVVTVSKGYSSTDRKISGTRLRHPGKGRTGARIQVWSPGPYDLRTPLLDHNQAETYRSTSEVRDWIDDRIDAEKKARMAAEKRARKGIKS